MRFTIFSCLIHYILPLVLISFIYFKIYKFLRTRRFQNATVCRKQKKTNFLLLSVSLIFLVRWWRANKYSRASSSRNTFQLAAFQFVLHHHRSVWRWLGGGCRRSDGLLLCLPHDRNVIDLYQPCLLRLPQWEHLHGPHQ